MAEQCEGLSQNGKPCSAKPLPGECWCAWHHPERAQERLEWSRKGGAGKSNQARARKQIPAGVMTPLQWEGVLGLTVSQVLSGRVEPNVASAVAGLARAAVAVRQVGQIEERLLEIEAAIATPTRKGA